MILRYSGAVGRRRCDRAARQQIIRRCADEWCRRPSSQPEGEAQDKAASEGHVEIVVVAARKAPFFVSCAAKPMKRKIVNGPKKTRLCKKQLDVHNKRGGHESVQIS